MTIPPIPPFHGMETLDDLPPSPGATHEIWVDGHVIFDGTQDQCNLFLELMAMARARHGAEQDHDIDVMAISNRRGRRA